MGNRSFSVVVCAMGIALALVISIACASPVKPPEGTFKSVSAALHYACGVRSDGTIDCWGSGNDWEPIPNGSFRSVDTGISDICGIRQDDSITCWPLQSRDLSAGISPPHGSFHQVATDVRRQWTCAVRTDGGLICWRDDVIYGPVAPTLVQDFGILESISEGGGGVCAVRTNHTVACWGETLYGPTLTPPGLFLSISMGAQHACGITSDETVFCWGSNSNGQLASPTGSFTAVSAGSFHTCGIRTDQSIECWGDEKDAKLDAPSGSFTSISAGPFYTCAIRIDDTVTCWGRK